MRKTTQALLPANHEPTPAGQYDIYPGFPISDGKIQTGFAALAGALKDRQRVIIDGYGGVLWDDFQRQLNDALTAAGITADWVNIADAMLPETQIDAMVAPFLGGDDPIFGTRFTGHLRDFFDPALLRDMTPPANVERLTIVYGTGAGLLYWDAAVMYLDVPKNEIQFRSRAGSVTNLGASEAIAPKPMYKRFYFVDWVALNRHKADLLPRINWIVDAQRPDDPAFTDGVSLRHALSQMATNYFRVRPWFEPGAWGGQWIKMHIPQLPQDPPNYAWSFELIVPENGLLLESGGKLLEVSFDFLMYHDHHAVLGACASRFGFEFPIRFDFLDTFDGGNLSVQCHPRPDFIREHFGETFTQDETYYILDCEDDAVVYLGFQDGIDPEAFRRELETSQAEAKTIDIPKYVQVHPAKKHDLFLIPNGTIHCSGINNMVLEISATPYIFTFKMYDWMRLDLDGKPRPINIERAFANLYFEERSGDRVKNELLSQPMQIDNGEGWALIHQPTHPVHFYDVHRFDMDARAGVDVHTHDSVHVLSLVEGQTVVLETANGCRQRFNYAETFVVPAAAGRYRLINENDTPIKVIKAFVKADFGA